MNNDAIRQFVRRELRAVTVGVATAIGLGGGLPAAIANPIGGTVVSGQGAITSPNATTTLINQQSSNLILNWSSFNVGSNETVRFVQPSTTSIALNNILSQSPSQIFGHIDANGRVVLINPNGILFGRTAQLNVGSLIASSLELKQFDPTTGHLSFQSLSGHPGAIDNEGSITAGPGGSVALLGGTVLNNGLVVADYGTVAMGAGNVATLDFYGGGLLRLQVSGDVKSNSTGAAAVQNNGQIQANGGQVVLTAAATQDVFASAVNNTGVIRANRVENVGGAIELSGPDGVVANSGTLDASGKGAGSTGGTVKVTGQDVGLFGGSTINASGPAGGGTVLVGGGFHGADSSVQDASHTYVDASATINADATTDGSGGNVAVWSNDATRYYGNISARGAGQGAGGYTEVSGKAYLDYEGLVDLQAPSGKLGTLLLDPAEITIEAGANGTDTNITTSGPGPFADTSSGASSVLVAGTINNQLATADVTVTTSTGDIVISNTAGAVVLGPATANGSKLTLNSAAGISWDAGWSYTNNGQLTLYAAGGSISAGATGEAIALGGPSPLLMQATGGIGSSAIPVETTGLTSVAAGNGNTGGVYISNSGSGDVAVSTLNNPATANAVNGLSTTGTDVSLVNNAGAISLSQPVAAGTGSVTLHAVGGALALGADNVSGAGVTLQGTGVTQSAGSTVDAGAGDILVDGGGGAVGMAGSLTTTSNTATAATVKDATTVALPAITTGATGTTTIGAGDVSGAVTQSGATAISTGTLAGSTAGTVTLDNGNTIPTVGAFTSAGFTLDDGALNITGALAGGAGDVDLTSTGTISESGGGLISTTGTLTTSSVGGTTLGGANLVSNFNATNTTSGNVTLTNGAALTITGISQAGGGSVTANNTGGTTVTGTVGAGAGAVTLTDAGAISETGGGHVSTTGLLTTSSAGGTTLGGANAVGSLNATNTTSGNISLTNGRALTIAGISQAGGGSVSVNNSGGTTLTTAISAGAGSMTLEDTTGTLALGANVSGAGVTLQGKGVTQSSGSTVNAGAGDILVDGGGGAIAMAGSLTTTSNSATAATVENATTVALPTITTGSSGTTTIGASDISGAVTQSASTAISTGTLTGHTTGSVALGNANTIPTLGAFTSNGFTLNSIDPLSITGAVAGGAGAVHLTSNGTIAESGSGLISTTGTLTTHSAGGTTLGGANAVSGFSPTNTIGGNISLTNGAALTITGLSQTGAGLVSVTNSTTLALSGTNSTDGNLSLTSTGGGVTLGSTGSDSLTVTGALSVSADGSIIEQGGSSATAANTQLTLASASGDLILKNAATLGTITLTGTGHDLDLEGTNQGQINGLLTGSTWAAVTVVDNAAAITLPNFDVTGSLAVTAPGISQAAGPIAVGGTTTLTASGNPISLNDGSNTFGGEVDFSGSVVTLASAGGLASAGTASGALHETASGTISEGSAGIQLTGAAGANTATFTVTGATHDVDLGSASNNFNADAVTVAAGSAGTVGNVRVVDTNATSLSLTLPGTLTSLVLSDSHAPITIAGGTFTGVGAGTNLAGGTTTLAVTAGGTITQSGALSVAGTSAFDANGGLSDINLGNTGNILSGAVMLNGKNVTVANTTDTTLAGASTASNLTLDAGGAIAFGSTGTDSTTVTGALIVQGLSGSGATGGAVSQAGTLSVGTTAAIDAGGNAITLSNSGNTFGGPVTLTGGAVVLANSQATTLGGANDVSSLTLDAGGAVTFGTLSTDSTTVANDLIVQGAGGSGAAGGAVTQVGTLSVGGTTDINANTRAITLGNAGNSFGGNVSFAGGAVTLANAGALSSSGTASGNLSETAAGTISEGAGGIQLTGSAGTDTATFTIAGAAGDVNLGNAANDFNGEATTIAASGGTVGNVMVADTNATFVPLTLPGTLASLVLSDPNAPIAITAATLTGVGAGTNLAGGTATLAVTAGGPISQSGALSVGGASAFSANGGAGNIALSNAANAFNGGITLAGNNVTVANTTGTTIAGASTAGNLTLDAGGAVSFGSTGTDSTTVTNGLIVQGLAGGPAGGTVGEAGKLSVGGTTSINAGTNDIVLANAANTFTGSITVTGGAVTLANSHATTLAGANDATSLTIDAGGAVAFGASGTDSTTVTNGLVVQGAGGSGAAGGAVTQGSGLTIGGSTTINAGSNDITLAKANSFGGDVAFTGHNVTLAAGTGGLMSSGSASGTLTETSAGTITQGGALSVTGHSTLTASGGTGDITLSNASNAFAGSVTLSGGAVTLANADPTTLAGTEKVASLTIDAGGAVTFGAASTDSTTVTNGLIVQGVSGSGNAGGAVTQAGALSVGGTASILAGSNDITLAQANTFGGAVTFTGRNVLLVDGAGSLTTASGTASGTLTEIAKGSASNLYVGTLTAGGNLLLIAGNSILGTSSQATVNATDAQVRYGLEDANGQLGSTDPNQQIGFQALPGASQVQLTVWLPAPGTQLENSDLRATQSDLNITKQPFAAGEQSVLYSPNFGLTAAEVAGSSAAIRTSFAGTQTQSAVAQSAATQGTQSVLVIDWASYNPNVSLFGTLNPAVCLPADQRDEGVASGSGCAAATASLEKSPTPIQLAMVPTQEGWKAMPLFRLTR
jgi:filamentous hemagglutinin family protein